jgi:hypothetical protein
MSEECKRQFPVKFKINESPEVLKFANLQSNFNDTVRYLIEKEIAENGIRNLQQFIPPIRDKEFFTKEFSSKETTSTLLKLEEQGRGSPRPTFEEVRSTSAKRREVHEEVKKEEKPKNIPSCYE